MENIDITTKIRDILNLYTQYYNKIHTGEDNENFTELFNASETTTEFEKSISAIINNFSDLEIEKFDMFLENNMNNKSKPTSAIIISLLKLSYIVKSNRKKENKNYKEEEINYENALSAIEALTFPQKMELQNKLQELTTIDFSDIKFKKN